MSNLLQVVRLGSEIMRGKGPKAVIPLIVEFQIDPMAKPFLVSSTSGFLWVEEAHPGNVVKAAVRKGPAPGDLFLGVVQSIAERGAAEGWGNSFPFTRDGVKGAIEYVRSYDLDELELIIPRLREEKGKKGKKGKGPSPRPEWLRPETFNLPCRPSSWVPDDCVVVVPRDKSYVGILGHLDAKSVVVCVHNPSRGVAIARGGVAIARGGPKDPVNDPTPRKKKG